jgi:hypothetical protein
VEAQRETIRAANGIIREFAEDPRIPSHEEWEFFCECGCFTLVSMTLAEFDERGAVWAPGHEAGASLSASG